MPSIPLHPRPASTTFKSNTNIDIDINNPLPTLLQTPSGLAIFELQGTINLPPSSTQTSSDPDADTTINGNDNDATTFETPIGKIMFPDYSPQNPSQDKKWMKRVYLYVGRYQRMTGEVKELGNPIAVIQRRRGAGMDVDVGHAAEGVAEDELEIVEIVRYKLLFKSRPEPVNDV